MADFDPKKYSSKAPLHRLVKTFPKNLMKHVHQGMSVRTFDHIGHHVEVETMYRVKVDGKLFKIPLVVDSTGRVSCHSIPNYSTSSAIDMIKVVIEQFKSEFVKKKSRKGAGRGSHTQEHHH